MTVRILKKLLINSLIINLLGFAREGAQAQDVPSPGVFRSKTPMECLPSVMDCTCFDGPSLDKIANGLREREQLRFQLEQYKKFSEGSITQKAWYEDDTLYYVALVGSAVVGGFVGYAVGHK